MNLNTEFLPNRCEEDTRFAGNDEDPKKLRAEYIKQIQDDHRERLHQNPDREGQGEEGGDERAVDQDAIHEDRIDEDAFDQDKIDQQNRRKWERQVRSQILTGLPSRATRPPPRNEEIPPVGRERKRREHQRREEHALSLKGTREAVRKLESLEERRRRRDESAAS